MAHMKNEYTKMDFFQFLQLLYQAYTFYYQYYNFLFYFKFYYSIYNLNWNITINYINTQGIMVMFIFKLIL